MIHSNISLNEIGEAYKDLVASACDELEKTKAEIGGDSSPENMMKFQTAMGVWQLITSASINALTSVTDSLKEGLRAR